METKSVEKIVLDHLKEKYLFIEIERLIFKGHLGEQKLLYCYLKSLKTEEQKQSLLNILNSVGKTMECDCGFCSKGQPPFFTKKTDIRELSEKEVCPSYDSGWRQMIIVYHELFPLCLEFVTSPQQKKDLADALSIELDYGDGISLGWHSVVEFVDYKEEEEVMNFCLRCATTKEHMIKICSALPSNGLTCWHNKDTKKLIIKLIFDFLKSDDMHEITNKEEKTDALRSIKGVLSDFIKCDSTLTKILGNNLSNYLARAEMHEFLESLILASLDKNIRQHIVRELYDDTLEKLVSKFSAHKDERFGLEEVSCDEKNRIFGAGSMGNGTEGFEIKKHIVSKPT